MARANMPPGPGRRQPATHDSFVDGNTGLSRGAAHEKRPGFPEPLRLNPSAGSVDGERTAALWSCSMAKSSAPVLDVKKPAPAASFPLMPAIERLDAAIARLETAVEAHARRSSEERE